MPNEQPTPLTNQLDLDLQHDILSMQSQGAKLSQIIEHVLVNQFKHARSLERQLRDSEANFTEMNEENQKHINLLRDSQEQVEKMREALKWAETDWNIREHKRLSDSNFKLEPLVNPYSKALSQPNQQKAS